MATATPTSRSSALDGEGGAKDQSNVQFGERVTSNAVDYKGEDDDSPSTSRPRYCTCSIS